MVTCFFCQTLLSDYLEDVLPSSRKAEIKKHLDECKRCPSVLQDLSASLEILAAIPSHPISHELALQITETATEGVKSWLQDRAFVRTAAGVGAFAAIAATTIYLFPTVFGLSGTGPGSSRLTRYYPLQNGAAEVVEEHANWLQVREPSMRSVWEEGGLSPEEFEKTFQPRGLASDVAEDADDPE